MIGRYFRVQIDGHLGMIQMRNVWIFLGLPRRKFVVRDRTKMEKNKLVAAGAALRLLRPTPTGDPAFLRAFVSPTFRGG